jgi:hypothetical protein
MVVWDRRAIGVLCVCIGLVVALPSWCGAVCTVGEGILGPDGHCCKSITNKHCTAGAEDDHTKGWHFVHPDTNCDTVIHYLTSDVTDRGTGSLCVDVTSCANCWQQSMRQGGQWNGQCAEYVPSGTYITHTACPNKAFPASQDCTHS